MSTTVGQIRVFLSQFADDQLVDLIGGQIVVTPIPEAPPAPVARHARPPAKTDWQVVQPDTVTG